MTKEERRDLRRFAKKYKLLVKTLMHYEPILRQYGCTKNGDHDDPSWCTELCCDYGKMARDTLMSLSDNKENNK